MTTIVKGQVQLDAYFQSNDASQHLLYIIDKSRDLGALSQLANELPDLGSFQLVSLTPSADHDLTYLLRRAARRLLQGPDAFPLFLFATPEGLPYYSVAAPANRDVGHEIGLETHLKKVRETIEQTPHELQDRATSLSHALRVPSVSAGPLGGQLVERALKSWTSTQATPAQCLAMVRISKHYPEFQTDAVKLWTEAWQQSQSNSGITEEALTLLTEVPTGTDVDLGSHLSKIETELNEITSSGQLCYHPRTIQLCLALSQHQSSVELRRQTIQALWNSMPASLEQWRLDALSNFITASEYLDAQHVAQLTTELCRRTNFESSSSRDNGPLAAFTESYQEGWDGPTPDLFANACFGLVALCPESRSQLISLLETHADNLNAEPKFYPTLLSTFVALFAKPDLPLKHLTTRSPIRGKADYAAQAHQLEEAGLNARPWPGTGLVSAPLAMGTLRLSRSNGAKLLQEAWDCGVRVFDMGANFAGGHAEKLIGNLLQQAYRRNQNARQEATLISRVGLVPASLKAQWNQLKDQPNFDKSSVSHQGSTLCLAPEWLDMGLSNSLSDLGVECIDIALVAQPELFLLEARERNAKYRDLLDRELEALLVPAFEFLEKQCDAGRIQFYGVASGTLGLHGDSIEHLSPDLIQRAANAAGGAKHRCRVLQAPLNLLETGILDWQNAAAKSADPVSAAEFILQNDMTLLTHRPLNAAQGSKLHRFAPLPANTTALDFKEAIKTLKQVEETLRDAFNLPIRLGDNEISLAELFRFADELEEAVPELGGIAEWEHLNQTMISPRMQRLLQFMDQLPDPEEAKAFAVIRPTWLESYQACLDATFHQMREKTLQIHQTFEEAYAPLVAHEFKDHPANAALSLLVEVPLVPCVVSGPTDLSDLGAWSVLMGRSQSPDAIQRMLQFGERVHELVKQAV